MVEIFGLNIAQYFHLWINNYKEKSLLFMLKEYLVHNRLAWQNV